jgi:hypothetical protein
VLARSEDELAAEVVGEVQGEALVRARAAQPVAARLAADQLGRTVLEPRLRTARR